MVINYNPSDGNPAGHHFPPPPSYSHQPSSNSNHLPSSGSNPAVQASEPSHRHKFSLSKLSNWTSDTKNFRIQGWDPVLIIAQILAIQALHYLTLSLITPPLLTIFSDPLPLEYEGGPANVAMIMDWREMAGYGTLHRSPNKLGGWAGYGKLPDSLGRRPSRLPSWQPNVRHESSRGVDASGAVGIETAEEWSKQLQDAIITDMAADPHRRWVLSVSWFLASMIGVSFLYYIVRRPIHIMDHSLTICLNHLILTTYYSAAFPTSLWFYIVLIVSAIAQIVWAENICVKREMREGLGVGWKVDHRPDDLPSGSTGGGGGGNNGGKLNNAHHYEKVPDSDR